MALVVVIDDDRGVLLLIERALKDTGTRLEAAATAAEGLELVETAHPDVVLLDVMLPGTSGLDIFRQIQQRDAKLPVIFITGSGASETAIEAMKLGAFDYLLKPLDLSEVRALVDQALEVRRLMHTPVHVPSEPADGSADCLVGRSREMHEVYKAIGRVAPQEVAVLIRGESGTGKELVARAIYQHSARVKGPFLAVNCAALTETLLESELFGHEKGAFTGADQRRIGKFEQCSGGTIFLDEIGDMAPLMQSKVLRVLQEQRFERVGGMSTIQTDVRMIAATNRDLEGMVAEGLFREDLFFRINGFTINLPPLRERKRDIPLLLDHFLTILAPRMAKDVHTIAPDALSLLNDYPWPGNVRELQSVLRQAILHSAGPVIIPTFLPQTIRQGPQPKQQDGSDSSCALASFIEERLGAGSTALYGEALEHMERHLLMRTLSETHGNQSTAARILGITRGSLRNKLRTLGISIEQVVNVEDSLFPQEVASP